MTLAPLVLPKELSGIAHALTKAVREVEVHAIWPEDKPAFIEAPQASAIARPLIATLHTELVNAKIAYLFREDMKRRGQVRLGVAAKASSKVAYLTGFDFVLDFNWGYWGKLTPVQRIALVDHELTHCGRTEAGAWTLIPHDVEEFSSIVRRWGLWTPDLLAFETAVKAGSQLGLFAEGGAAPAKPSDG